MATGATPFIESLQLASAAFVEGCGSLGDAVGMTKDEARPSLAYGYQAMTSGFVQLKALARRYVQMPECANGTAAKPILTDLAFRAAVAECAGKLDAAVHYIGLPGKRIADALRRWVETNTPADARALAMACDAVERMMKMKSGRAA